MPSPRKPWEKEVLRNYSVSESKSLMGPESATSPIPQSATEEKSPQSRTLPVSSSSVVVHRDQSSEAAPGNTSSSIVSSSTPPLPSRPSNALAPSATQPFASYNSPYSRVGTYGGYGGVYGGIGSSYGGYGSSYGGLGSYSRYGYGNTYGGYGGYGNYMGPNPEDPNSLRHVIEAGSLRKLRSGLVLML